MNVGPEEALRRCEERLRQAEERLRLMEESVKDYAILYTDTQGVVTFWSKGAERVFGYAEHEILGRPAAVLFTPEDREAGAPHWELDQAVETGHGEDVRWHLRKDGSLVFLNGVVTPIRDGKGGLLGFAKVARDVTEQKFSEDKLREGEERHRAILESISDAFFALDRAWRFTYVNRQAEALLGRSRDDLLGKDIWEEYAPAVGTKFDRSYHKAMDEGVSVTFEAFYPPHDRWYEVHAYPSTDGLAVYFRDVNERKRHEEEHARLTAASEQQRRIYETALSSTPDFHFIFDTDGRFTYANASLLAIWRKRLDEVVGRDFFDLGYSPEEAALHQSEIQEVIATRQPLRAETPFTSHLGERQYEYIFMPVLGADGAVEAVVGSTRDITERKRHEEKLRESEERHRSILESITDGFYFLDRDWRFTHVNPKAEVLLGRSGSDLLGKSVWDEFSFAVDTVFYRDYHRAMDENVAVTSESFYPPHDRWYEVHAYPSPDGLSVFFRDIGERKRAEEALQESEKRTRAILTSITDAFFAVGRDWRFTYVNPQAERILGRKTGELLGKVLWDEYPGLAGTVFERAYLRAVEEQVSTSVTVHYPDHDRWYEIRNYPAPDGLSVYFQDVTERRRQEEALRAAKDAAERANRAKDHFLAVLSHELRTPLNPILLAASSMLERTPAPDEVRPTLEMIRQNVKLQARLIDDLLDVMRIVQGKMPLHWGVSDCHALVEQSIEICRSEFLGKAQEVVLDLAAERHHVNADSARLHQVLWNLVRNAVKFTPEGGKITVRTRNEDDGEGRIVVIEVTDTGIGIEPDVLPTIWDPFQQGETTITRRFGGLGLGLAICKGVVDAHGGTLAVESEGSGMGTTFRVLLKTLTDPVIEAENGGGEVRSLPPLNRMNILLIEDEVATLRLMTRLLKGLGHRVTAAGTVADAWDAFQAGDFDLIVSDIGLPDGTGLDLMRKVKAVRRVPAIALTGYGMDEDVRRSREAGFTTHMTKPIDFTKLEAVIRQVAN